jgi:ABC-type Zn2+ transport system substrate-binding protein/surface adhesin
MPRYDDSKGDPELSEVLFEMHPVGNAVKVSAIDPVTNTEVCVVGSAHASNYTLKMNALRKLKAVLRKRAAKVAKDLNS